MNTEPAFPCVEERKWSTDPLATPRKIQHTGMTLRDYFAGQALVTLASFNKVTWSNDMARQAYDIADAMLGEREKSQ